MVRTNGRSLARSVYGHVITKFSEMGRLPHFLSYGAPHNPQVFKLFNLFQLRVFQEKTRSDWLNLLSNFHNFAFLDIEVHEIANTPLMQTIQVLLKQFKITSRVNDSRTFTVISIKSNSTVRSNIYYLPHP